MQIVALSAFNYVSRHANRFWKNVNTRLFGFLLLSYANYAYALSLDNPFVTVLCNVANLFSTPLVTALSFIATSLLIITVMVTEAKGVIGTFLKILICTVALLTLKSLISTLTGYSFGC